MTIEDTIKILELLREFYPKGFEGKTTQDVLKSATLWHSFLKDHNPKILFPVIHSLIATSKWQPTIAEINEAYANAVAPVLKTSVDDEWGKVMEIVQKGMYAQRENPQMFDVLKEETREICRTIGWWELCTTQHPDTLRKFFYERYGRIQEKAKVSAITEKYTIRIDSEIALIEEGYT